MRYDIQRRPRNLKYGYDRNYDAPKIFLLGQSLEQIQENTLNVSMDLCVVVVPMPQSSYKVYQHSDKNIWEVPQQAVSQWKVR